MTSESARPGSGSDPGPIPAGGLRVGIVGLGATGISVFMKLVDRVIAAGLAERTEVILFESRPLPGTGVAYGTDHDCHLLNMRVDSMSMVDGRPDDFASWLRRRLPNGCSPTGRRPGGADGAESYVPRRHFSAYLRSCLRDTMTRAARSGITVRQLRAEVTDCREDGDQVVLAAGDRRFPVSHTVLCPGDLPSTNFQEFCRRERYINPPWDFARYDAIRPHDRVAVLGAGLTAVDIVLLLRARGHQGPIACVTRRSGLPKVQPLPGDQRPYVPRVITHETIHRLTGGYRTALNLEQARRLFVAELTEGTGSAPAWSYDPGRLRGEWSAHALSEDIERARRGRLAWYPVLTATWRIVPHLWRRLDDSAKSEFMRSHYSFWGMYRHCVPLCNAVKLHELMDAGQLTALSGLCSITPNASGFDVRRRAPDGSSRTHAFDHLINATGTGYDVARSESPLLRGMVRRGDAAAHPLGGVDVDFDTLRLRDSRGTVSPRTYLIGPLTRGVHFYTNGVEISRVHADRLADSLITGS